jgi:PAS domain S-box-containing protein
MNVDHPPSEMDDADLYRALVEGIPAILYIDRPDGYSTNFFTSPQAVQLLGYTPDEWGDTQELWVQRLHPEDRERVIEQNARCNTTGEPFRSEYRLLAKDGGTVWLRDEAVLIHDERGEPLHWRGLMLDITPQKEAEEKLRWSMDVLQRTIQERRELAQRIESAQEEERRRIAADIHDDPIQVMSAVDMRLQMLAEEPEIVTAAGLSELHSIVRQSIERLRALVFELRPAALDRDGLVVALSRYLEHLAGETGLAFDVVDALEVEPSPDLRAVLFRSAQEAITNTRKHAGATRVDVSVATVEQGISITVRDDGCGFDPARSEPEPGHLGLSTMVERAELLGGWCTIESEPGAGATIECWLPTDADTPDA